MTTKTTTTGVPSWIDISAIVPADLSEEVDATAAALRAFIDQARPLAERYIEVLGRMERTIAAAADQADLATKAGQQHPVEDVEASVGLMLHELTGCRSLYDLGTEVQDLFDQDRAFGRGGPVEGLAEG